MTGHPFATGIILGLAVFMMIVALGWWLIVHKDD